MWAFFLVDRLLRSNRRLFHEFEVVLKFCCKTVKPLKTTLYSQCSFAIVSTKMWENVILFYYSSVKGISLKNFPWRGKKVPTSMLLLLTPLPINFCAMISNFREQNLASSWRNPWMTLLLTSLHQLLLYTLLRIAFSSTKCTIKKEKTT